MSRFISGITVGISYVILPIYVGEVFPTNERACALNFINLCELLGILLQFIIGGLLPITKAAFISCMISAAFTSLVFIVLPESPYYLHQQRAPDRALVSLRIVYTEDEAIAQNKAIKDYVDKLPPPTSLWRILNADHLRKNIYLILALFLVQQLSGVQSIIFYIDDLLIKNNINPKHAAITFGVIQCVSATICTLVLNTFGTKTMLLVSTLGCAAANCIIAAYVIILKYDIYVPPIVHTSLLFGGTSISSFSYSLGLGPLPFILCGEIFPLHTKMQSCCLSIVAVSCFSAIITFGFPIVATAYGAHYIFILYSIVLVAALPILHTTIPHISLESLHHGP